MYGLLPAFLLLLPGALVAQTASYTYIDQKAPNTNPGFLTALNLPKVGTTFEVQVQLSYTNPIEHTESWLLFGASNPNVRLPSVRGVWLYCSAEIIVPTPRLFNVSRAGLGTMSFKIPNSPLWLGVRFYQQLAHINKDLELLMSRGGVGVIGK